jgi:putative transcriptional regulator
VAIAGTGAAKCVIDAQLVIDAWCHAFVESAVFTKQVKELLTDEGYASLQWHLASYPKAGRVIRNTGGLRKVRWGGGHHGKEHAGVNKKLFGDLVESMTQMSEIVRGKRAPSRKFHVDAITIKTLRAQIGLSQTKFARLLNVDVGTLRNWEQGRREPTGAAKALLTAISRDPKNVLKALAA